MDGRTNERLIAFLELLTEQNTYTLADLGMLGLESGYYLWQRHGEAGFGHRREAQTLRHRLGLMDKLSQTNLKPLSGAQTRWLRGPWDTAPLQIRGS